MDRPDALVNGGGEETESQPAPIIWMLVGLLAVLVLGIVLAAEVAAEVFAELAGDRVGGRGVALALAAALSVAVLTAFALSADRLLYPRSSRRLDPIAAVAFGIAFTFSYPGGWVGAALCYSLSVALGVFALHRTRTTDRRLRGRTLAQIAIILGAIGFLGEVWGRYG